MVDVHPRPETALVDGAQALSGASLDELAEAVATLPAMLGRTLAPEDDAWKTQLTKVFVDGSGLDLELPVVR